MVCFSYVSYHHSIVPRQPDQPMQSFIGSIQCGKVDPTLSSNSSSFFSFFSFWKSDWNTFWFRLQKKSCYMCEEDWFSKLIWNYVLELIWECHPASFGPKVELELMVSWFLVWCLNHFTKLGLRISFCLIVEKSTWVTILQKKTISIKLPFLLVEHLLLCFVIIHCLVWIYFLILSLWYFCQNAVFLCLFVFCLSLSSLQNLICSSVCVWNL